MAGSRLARAGRELVRARLIDPPGGDRRYRLRHALVGEAMLAGMTVGEQRSRHADLARALGGQAPPDRAGEVARHWAAAVEPAEEAGWRLIAARAAGGMSAFSEAATHWQRLIELGPRVWPPGIALVDAYLRALGALDRCGDNVRALVLAEAALPALPAGTDPRKLALLHDRIATYRWVRDDVDTLAPLDRALALLAGLPPGPEHVTVLHSYSAVLKGRGRDAEARDLLDRALVICRAHGPMAEEIKVVRDIAGNALQSGDIDDGLRLSAEAAALAEPHGDRLAAIGIAYYRAESQLVLGHLEEAATMARAGLELARRSGLERHVNAEFLRFCHFEALAEPGRPGEAEPVLATSGPSTPAASDTLARAYADLLRGDRPAAIRRAPGRRMFSTRTPGSLPIRSPTIPTGRSRRPRAPPSRPSSPG